MPDQYFQPSTVGGRVPAMGPTGRLPRGLSQVCDNSRAENLATAGCMTDVYKRQIAAPGQCHGTPLLLSSAYSPTRANWCLVTTRCTGSLYFSLLK